VTGVNVSRETRAGLERFAALLTKWQGSINLVAPNTLDDLWPRHIEDSLQLLPLLPDRAQAFVDLGSGGGFPGLVLAIALKSVRPDARMTLIESDARKGAFLNEAIRATGANARVITGRIDDIAPSGADVVTARALAPLPRLLGFAARHLTPEGTALLQKGGKVHEELAAARADWHFEYALYPSLTSEDGVILQIRELSDASAKPA